MSKGGGNTESFSSTVVHYGAAAATSRNWSGATAQVWAIVRYDPDCILRAWTAILLLGSVDWIWARYAGLQFGGLMPGVKGVATLAALGFAIGVIGQVRQVAEAVHYCALWIAFAVAVVIYTYVIATLRLPLWDKYLARADDALGFDWSAGYDWVMSSSWFTRFTLEHAYNSMLIEVFASIGFFAMIGRSDRNRELLWVAMLAITICATVSGLCPAFGPYTQQTGLSSCAAVLVTIRDRTVTRFTLPSLTGIVAFPSCHALMAVLLTYVHRSTPKVFIPIAIMNTLMLIATPFAGHHYLVDLIAGVTVLAISISIVHATMRPQDRPLRPPLDLTSF